MAVLIFIVVLLVLIVGHELGHFIVAKLSGMRVDEFGVGFPPKIWGKRFGKGETEYTINWLPFGGFVKIFGEDKEGSANDPRAFSNRPAILQAATLIAGPFANVVLAFILSSAAFMAGAPAIIDATDVDAHIVGTPQVLIGDVLKNSPAEMAGIKSGDQITSIAIGSDTYTITSSQELSDRVASASGPVTFTLIRNGETRDIVATPTTGLISQDPERRAVGVATALVGHVSYSPLTALWKAFTTTGHNLVFIAASLFSLIVSAFTLSADVSNIAGPVGIASLTGEAARFGFGSLLSFAALLSVNLAIINILPFPALDGGRLLFLIIEKLTRRRIPASVQEAVNAGGFFILIALMIAVTIGDISRLF